MQAQANNDDDLNDRDTGVPSDLPDLEEAHVPHHVRRARAQASRDSRKKPTISGNGVGMRRDSSLQHAAE